MKKPWEETWSVRWDGDYGAAYVETTCTDDTICVDSPEKAALLCAAPDMARVLLALEWNGTTSIGENGVCPSCYGRETRPHEPRTGHTDVCALDAALRKAGVR